MAYQQLILFALTGALALLLAGLQVRISNLLQVSSGPRQDRWHKRPTPSAGGIAILLAVAAVYLTWFRGEHAGIATGAVAVWALGLVDDIVRLRPWVKLLGQTSISAAVVCSGIVFHATPWLPANYAFSIVWLVVITNAFNLIDNMDGLCAGVTVTIALFRFSLLAARGDWMDAQLVLLIAAAYAGFLRWNYRPARIFMGDCGSMLAGFSLAALTIATPIAHTKAFVAGLFYPALTFTYPIFDVCLVSILRKLAGRPISMGGRDHSSHRMIYLGLSETKTVWMIWLLTAFGCAAGLFIHSVPVSLLIAACAIGAVVVAFGLLLALLSRVGISKQAFEEL
ncbi:MAG: undecaprenyl/decaprenyl-phosphate alpha-N-acetylglucosaminyl 1-phosphate transferase [Bryobacterales bacterium]|nr:undecaprenyl/decaprenyl-phosphate alpha-N-acetylglucosaminyl 1-phosphate transferase [Bryobacterales bacterium]